MMIVCNSIALRFVFCMCFFFFLMQLRYHTYIRLFFVGEDFVYACGVDIVDCRFVVDGRRIRMYILSRIQDSLFAFRFRTVF